MVISRGFRGKSANVTEKGQEKCLILKLTCTDNAQRSLNQKHFAQLSMVLDHVKAERAVERKKVEGATTKASFNISQNPPGGK